MYTHITGLADIIYTRELPAECARPDGSAADGADAKGRITTLEKENRIDLLRDRIEQIDGDMAALFEQRMECAAEIAAYKREMGLPILDKGREKVLIERNSKKLSNREFEPYYREFLTGMMDISKKYQHRLSEGLRVAYSGIEGSFASICTGRLFPEAERIPHKCFADA